MPLFNFRVPPGQSDLSHVEFIADDGKIRAIGRIKRDIIEDAFPNENYHRDRLAIVERNLGILEPIVQMKYDAADYTDYTDSLGIRSGNDKLIMIEIGDLSGYKLV